MGKGEEAGEEAADDDPAEDPGADKPGVDSKSIDSLSMTSIPECGPSPTVAVVNLELLVRLATLWEDADDPDDSSNERLGDRCTRRFIIDAVDGI